MKTKQIKKFVFEGLGFPVVLTNVPMIKIRGEWTLNINYNDLQKAVLLLLCHKKSPLTGNEIYFIRTYLEMRTTEFGAIFGVSHAAVLKWEKREDEYARIDPTTEVCIRLFLFGHLQKSGNAFRQLYEEIDIPHLAECRKAPEKKRDKIISIDAHEELRRVKIG